MEPLPTSGIEKRKPGKGNREKENVDNPSNLWYEFKNLLLLADGRFGFLSSGFGEGVEKKPGGKKS
jgi:hypothetical protein